MVKEQNEGTSAGVSRLSWVIGPLDIRFPPPLHLALLKYASGTPSYECSSSSSPLCFLASSFRITKMKSVLLASVFTALAAAAPVPNVIAGDVNGLEARQFGMGMGMGMTRNDLESGSGTCPKAIFIFARGSTEQGNMVRNIVRPLDTSHDIFLLPLSGFPGFVKFVPRNSFADNEGHRLHTYRALQLDLPSRIP